MISIAYLLLYMAAGVQMIRFLLPRKSPLVRGWLGAALGMVALFCGCTNSPLASICLAIEVFGGQCIALFALACAVSYMLSSYFSLYREQHFLHSKLRIVGVQRVHGRWSETDAKHFTTNDDGEN